MGFPYGWRDDDFWKAWKVTILGWGLFYSK
jgi:hypothetical protein